MTSLTGKPTLPSLADAHFSLYALIDRTDPNNIFSNNRLILGHWLDRMETQVIGSRWNADIFAGLQHTEQVKPLMPRYERLAAVTRTLCVFGAPERSQLIPEGCRLNCVVLTPDDALYDECFLIISHKSYTRAVIAQETSAGKFRGVYVTHPAQVRQLYNRLAQNIGL
ncbi:MAG: hypothetical protein GC204_12975 [Chloroflexi bacterium]|nr:hypothetical protein [Chloroflexota bacterium]